MEAPAAEEPQTLSLEDRDDAGSPLPSGNGNSPRRVLLRRPLQAVPSASDLPNEESVQAATERRKVLLAHKIRPGQTIKLKASKATATLRDDGQPDMQSESLVNAASRTPQGPQYGAEGDLLSFSVLGPVEEFAELSEAHGEGGMGSYGVPPLHPGTMRGTGGSTHHVFNQMDASMELARAKAESASARHRHHEMLVAN